VRTRTVAQGGKGAETEGTLERPSRRYEGPFGPIEIARGEKLRVTRIWGPHVPTVTLPWGPSTPEDPVAARRALREGVRCRVGEEEWVFRQPRFGILRRARALFVTSPRRAWVARPRSFATLSLEDQHDGAWRMRFSLAGGGRLAPGADRDDAVATALLFGSQLIHQTELGWAPF
jgi:hypothetical protein